MLPLTKVLWPVKLWIKVSLNSSRNSQAIQTCSLHCLGHLHHVPLVPRHQVHEAIQHLLLLPTAEIVNGEQHPKHPCRQKTPPSQISKNLDLLKFQAVFSKASRKRSLANLQIPSTLSVVIITSSHSWQRLLARGMSRNSAVSRTLITLLQGQSKFSRFYPVQDQNQRIPRNAWKTEDGLKFVPFVGEDLVEVTAVGGHEPTWTWSGQHHPYFKWNSLTDALKVLSFIFCVPIPIKTFSLLSLGGQPPTPHPHLPEGWSQEYPWFYNEGH